LRQTRNLGVMFAVYRHVLYQLAQELHQIVGETVVIVDDGNHGFFSSSFVRFSSLRRILFQMPVRPIAFLTSMRVVCLCLAAGAVGAGDEQVIDKAAVGLVAGATLAHRVEEGVERLRQLLLDLDIADGASAVAFLQVASTSALSGLKTS
jgi:hypothetical protein